MNPSRNTQQQPGAPQCVRAMGRARRGGLGRAVALVLLVLTAISIGFGVNIASADEPLTGFRVVVSAENPSLAISREFIADAFLKKATRWDNGEGIRPIDQRADSGVRAQFSRGVLRRSVSAVRNYWQQRIFSGRGVPPPELDSDAAVLRRVQQDRGAIGYVSEQADTSSVKVLSVR
jgi:hypothetical protein